MKKLIFTLLVILGSYHLQAQEVKALSLEEAITYAMNNNLSIKSSLINIADAEEQIIERRSFGLPRVNGTIGYNYFIQIPSSLVPAQFFDPTAPEGEFAKLAFGTRNDLTLGLSANSMVFDGSYFVGLRAAKAYRQYVDRELTSKKQEVKNAVIEAYLPALLLQQSRSTLENNITTIEKLLNETKALYKEGFVEQLDVDRLELSLANIQSELGNIDRQADLVYNVLKFQMGYPLEDPIVASDQIDQLLVPATSEELVDAVNFQSRPEYQVLSMGKQLSELNIELNKSTYLPSVGAFANYQQSAQGDNLIKDPTWIPTFVVGLNANIPIFGGFEKRAKLNRAKLDLAVLENQQRSLEHAISLEVSNARTAYTSAQSRLDDQKKNLALAERIYDMTQIKYREGVGSSIELVQAEQSLFETQQNHIQATYDLLLAKIGLDKALGK